MAFKVVVSDPKSRNAYQKEVEEAASGLVGKKIGQKVEGKPLGLDGYELEITGGSDKEGFPMRPDVEGQGRKRIVLAFPPGFHPERHGERKRKSVRGNTVSKDISQINLKVVKAGAKALDTLLGAKEKPKEGEPVKEEKPTEAKEKEAPKEAAKEAKPEKPTEAPKEEAKPEEKTKPAEVPKEEKMGVKTLEEKEKEAEKEEEKGEPAEEGKKKPEKKEEEKK